MIAFASLEVLTGKAQRKHWMLYLLAVLFVLRFVYLAQG
jgi:AGZA family xanthine/uracil permease-like MFS transporter